MLLTFPNGIANGGDKQFVDKQFDCLGIRSEILIKPNTISQSELLELVDGLNRDDDVNGVLVQLPVPKHIGEKLYFYHF